MLAAKGEENFCIIQTGQSTKLRRVFMMYGMRIMYLLLIRPVCPAVGGINIIYGGWWEKKRENNSIFHKPQFLKDFTSFII